ncbi:MAG: hypothetical protein A2W36_06975 [Chloroflexi bacterium RBG_16_58_14]|nr:MAG: hypothetical protein A2W36_06975 [Chloroflexi bacterium RBG_16_58_14]
MPWITPYTRFIILVIAGLAGVIAAGLTAVLQDNLVYLLFRPKNTPPPPKKEARIWVVYFLSVLICIMGGAFTAIELLPRPEVYITSPIEVGKHATVTVKTLPGTGCSIEYLLPSGEPSQSQELKPKDADANGICAWCWQIGTNTTPGKGQVIVTVGDTEKKTYKGVIEVIKPISSP